MNHMGECAVLRKMQEKGKEKGLKGFLHSVARRLLNSVRVAERHGPGAFTNEDAAQTQMHRI